MKSTAVDMLVEVEISATVVGGEYDAWVGGSCGRVWQLTDGAWVTHKSQCDVDVHGLQISSSGHLYVAGARPIQVLVRSTDPVE